MKGTARAAAPSWGNKAKKEEGLLRALYIFLLLMLIFLEGGEERSLSSPVIRGLHFLCSMRASSENKSEQKCEM